MDELKVEVDLQWNEMSTFMTANSNRFMKEIQGWEELFKRCYAAVFTRGQSYCFKYTSIVPFFDCINHSHLAETDYYLMNKELHVDPLQQEAYFVEDKYLNDVSILYQGGTEEDKEALENELIRGYQGGAEYEQYQQQKSLPGW